MNKQNRNRLIDTENKLVVTRGEGAEGVDKIGEAIYKVETSRYKMNVMRM